MARMARVKVDGESAAYHVYAHENATWPRAYGSERVVTPLLYPRNQLYLC